MTIIKELRAEEITLGGDYDSVSITFNRKLSDPEFEKFMYYVRAWVAPTTGHFADDNFPSKAH